MTAHLPGRTPSCSRKVEPQPPPAPSNLEPLSEELGPFLRALNHSLLMWGPQLLPTDLQQVHNIP